METVITDQPTFAAGEPQNDLPTNQEDSEMQQVSEAVVIPYPLIIPAPVHGQDCGCCGCCACGDQDCDCDCGCDDGDCDCDCGDCDCDCGNCDCGGCDCGGCDCSGCTIL